MKRRLRVGGDEGSVVFDDATGRVLPLELAAGPLSGFAECVGDEWVAVFADEGELILQIGVKRFPLTASSIRYHHDWTLGTTTLEAEIGPTGESVTYPAWWSESGLDPWDVRAVPERDEAEDLLAWVARTLTRDPGEQHRLLSDWE